MRFPRASCAAAAIAAAASAGCRDAVTPNTSPAVLLWHYPSQVSCSPRPPASDGRQAFVHFSDGYVRSFALSTGATAWSTLVGGALSDDIKAFGGRVIVQAGAGVSALSGVTGATLWTKSDSSDYPRGVMSFDSVAGVVVTGGQVRTLWGLSLNDGSVAWQADLGEAALSTVISGRSVFAGTKDFSVAPVDAAGHLVAVNLDTHASQWSFFAPKLQTSSGFVAPLAASSGVVVGNAASGRVYGVDGATGGELWHFDAGTFLGGSVSDGHLAYVPSNDGHLYAFDLKTGAEVWASYFGGPSLYTEPALLGDSTVLVKVGPTLYALERSSGRRLWTYRLNYNNICSAPLVIGDTVVFDAEDGIYAIRAPL